MAFFLQENVFKIQTDKFKLTFRVQLHSKLGSACTISTLATSCKEFTLWKRLWCWEGLGAGGEGDDRGWDGWMASLTRWTWVWVNSRSGWWTGRPGMLRFMGSQRVGHDWATELNWTDNLGTTPRALVLLTYIFFWAFSLCFLAKPVFLRKLCPPL